MMFPWCSHHWVISDPNEIVAAHHGLDGLAVVLRLKEEMKMGEEWGVSDAFIVVNDG